jgi:hypothetical protein
LTEVTNESFCLEKKLKGINVEARRTLWESAKHKTKGSFTLTGR